MKHLCCEWHVFHSEKKKKKKHPRSNHIFTIDVQLPLMGMSTMTAARLLPLSGLLHFLSRSSGTSCAIPKSKTKQIQKNHYCPTSWVSVCQRASLQLTIIVPNISWIRSCSVCLAASQLTFDVTKAACVGRRREVQTQTRVSLTKVTCERHGDCADRNH